MKSKEIENKINNELNLQIPYDYKDILLKYHEGEKVMDDKIEKKNMFFKPIFVYALLAIFVIGLGVFGTLEYDMNFKTNSTIEFDVNPSVELQINKKNKVTKSISLNEDGEKILEGMDLKNSDLNVAVNAILGSMYKNGFISETKNSILVSVQNKDKEKSLELQNYLEENINEILNGYSIEGAITIQEIDNSKSNDGISSGKRKYIEKIIEAGLSNKSGEAYTFEELSKLNINELNVILESKNTKVDGVKKTGSASKDNYIGEDKAKSIALKDANINNSKIKVDVELDYENGNLIYEVEFDYKSIEYEYEIEAVSGKILDKKKEVDNDEYENDNDDDEDEEHIISNTNKISKSQAKSIALKAASVNENSINDLEIELDGNKYEISFETKSYEYEYKINASTGKILDKKVKKNDDIDNDEDDDDEDDD